MLQLRLGLGCMSRKATYLQEPQLGFFKVKEKQKEEAGNAYRSGPLKKQSAGES
ncbi:hypothetical protein Hdeb2414_s0008g00292011 [Helianthus debilis subsp. tardiflorus]